MLDKRLLACANYVRENKKMVDVGTDHAKLPCYLVLSGKVSQALAADINEKPLQMAQKTIASHGLTEKISTVLSDGLAHISSQDADDVMIAGMGGKLIARIVLACDWVRDSAKHLILQPMTNTPHLRRELYLHGFEIQSETAVFENNHHYTVMSCIYTGKTVSVSEEFSLIGKLAESDTAEAKDYRRYQKERLLKVAQGLEKSATQTEQAKSIRELADKLI